MLISIGSVITMLLSFIIFLNAKEAVLAFNHVLILVENRLFSQKTSQKFFGKSCQISAEIDKSFSELFSFQCFMNDYSSPPPFVVRYAEGVTPVKSLNAFDIEDASGKPVSATMSSNVILGSVC